MPNWDTNKFMGETTHCILISSIVRKVFMQQLSCSYASICDPSLKNIYSSLLDAKEDLTKQGDKKLKKDF